MIAFLRRDDHLAKALEHRATSHQTTDVALIITPIAEQIAELERAIWEVFDAKTLDNAEDWALSQLGKIVAESDTGDGTLKLRIRLMIAAIRSDGSREALLSLLSLIPGAAWTITTAPGWVIVTQNSFALFPSSALARLLRVAIVDGVNLFSVTNESQDDPFTWPSNDGAIAGGEWASNDGAIAGDPWQGVRTA